MIVITLTSCPDALRGDLTKWLMEITAGVFVGHVSARIRERLWERVREHVKGGRATMVFSAANEQRLAFRIVNSEWTPVDFDGIELMLRPAGEIEGAVGESSLRPGYSKAAQRVQARRMTGAVARRPVAPHVAPAAAPSYVVMDIETTGLSPDKDSIIEMSAVRVCDGRVDASYSSLVAARSALPANIVELTGITDELLRENGRELSAVLPEFLSFIGESPLVAHNARFDMSFLNAACREHDVPVISNNCIDTLLLAKQKVKGVSSYSLKFLAEYFEVDTSAGVHRGLFDCMIVRQVYEKLMELG